MTMIQSHDVVRATSAPARPAPAQGVKTPAPARSAWYWPPSPRMAPSPMLTTAWTLHVTARESGRR